MLRATDTLFYALPITLQQKLSIPWGPLLRTPGLWACASMHLGIGWAFFTLLTCLPTYMSEVLHFDIKSVSSGSGPPDDAATARPFLPPMTRPFPRTTNKCCHYDGNNIPGEPGCRRPIGPVRVAMVTSNSLVRVLLATPCAAPCAAPSAAAPVLALILL